MVGTVAPWIRLLVSDIRRYPDLDIYDILARPAMGSYLDHQLFMSRTLVEGRFRESWSASWRTPYRDSLATDIARAYSEAALGVRQAAVIAFQEAVPEQRAAEVARSTSAAASYLGMRNEMTVLVARTRREGEEALGNAPLGMYKKWVSRGDGKVCDWCRQLARLPAIPVDQEFTHGSPVGRRQPPRVYLDLMCPPRHPRCRCKIIIVPAGSLMAAGVEVPGPLFVSANAVRSMKAEQYQALHEFHTAAMHELGQVLRKQREVGSG